MADDIDDDEGEEVAEGGGKKKGGKKIVLLAVVVLLIVVGAGAGAYFTGALNGLLGGAPEGEEHAEASQEEKHEEKPAHPAHYFDLDEMLVSLNGTGGRKAGYLKIQISLELDSSEDEKRVQDVMPRIIDNFQVFLREVRLEELEGSRGLNRIKEELLYRVNTAVYPTKVRDVLVKEMLIQ